MGRTNENEGKLYTNYPLHKGKKMERMKEQKTNSQLTPLKLSPLARPKAYHMFKQSGKEFYMYFFFK